MKEQYPPLLAATIIFFSREEQGNLDGIIKYRPEITYNNTRVSKNGRKLPDGIEIRFGDYRPTEEVRRILKDHGFSFSEKQTMWYAYDDASTRDFVNKYLSQEVDVDDTQYEKLNFWAKVRSVKEYDKFYNRTEFMVRPKLTEEIHFFNTKKELEKDYWPEGIIKSGALFFKKFYNKPINQEGEESEEPEENSGNDSEDEETTEQENEKIADRLQALAEGMQNQIDQKLNPATARQNPTPKRRRVVEGMRQEAYKMQDIQTFLFALSKAHRENKIKHYPLLQKIRTKKDVELIDSQFPNSNEENSEHFVKLGIRNVTQWTEAISQKGNLINDYSPQSQRHQMEKQRKLNELESKLVGKSIPGFFPTPKELVKRLIQLADIETTDLILDPSAGKGDILDAIMEAFPAHPTPLFAAEINPSLREILDFKNYQLIGSHFLEVNQRFDKIIMNPPFENGQDIDHVNHAYTLLNPGGRIVAIMGEGAFFRSYKKDKAFRAFLEQKESYISEPIKEAFRKSFNSTGITVRIVVIDKDKEGTEDSLPDEETELRIRAEAELELMKMELELARKKKGLSGSPDTIGLDDWEDENRWQVLNFR